MTESIGSLINKKYEIAPSVTKPSKREEFATLPEEVKTRQISFITLKELMTQYYPESEWVVESLIPEGLTVLSAQPASYKTWLLLDIAIAVASGGQLSETFDTTQTGVLMVDEENSERLLQQRLSLLGDDNELPIHFMIEKNFKLEDAQISKVIKFCKENKIGLVTIDSLVRVHSSNENDAVQMSEVFAKLRRFNKAKINVLVTHHNRKGGKTENPSQDMRGSSDILAAVDCHLSLKRNRENKQTITVTQTKVRFMQEIEPFEMEVISTDERVKFEYAGLSDFVETKRAKTTNAIKELLADGKTRNQKDILATLEEKGNKVNAKTLRSILKDMEEKKDLAGSPGKGSEILYKLT